MLQQYGLVAALVVVLGSTSSGVQGFYLPGVNPQSFADGES
jgi:hypothetical protein